MSERQLFAGEGAGAEADYAGWLAEELRRRVGGEWEVRWNGERYEIRPAGDYTVKREAGRTFIVWRHPDTHLTEEIEPAVVERIARNLIIHRWLVEHGYVEERPYKGGVYIRWVKEPPPEIVKLLIEDLPEEWRKAYESGRWSPPWSREAIEARDEIERAQGETPAEVSAGPPAEESPPVPTAVGAEGLEGKLEREHEAGAAEPAPGWATKAKEMLGAWYGAGAAAGPAGPVWAGLYEAIAPRLEEWREHGESLKLFAAGVVEDLASASTFGLKGLDIVGAAITRLRGGGGPPPAELAGIALGEILAGYGFGKALESALSATRLARAKIFKRYEAETLDALERFTVRSGDWEAEFWRVATKRVKMPADEAAKIMEVLDKDISEAPRFVGTRHIVTLTRDDLEYAVRFPERFEIPKEPAGVRVTIGRELPSPEMITFERYKPRARLTLVEKVGREAGGLPKTMLQELLEKAPERIAPHLEEIRLPPVLRVREAGIPLSKIFAGVGAALGLAAKDAAGALPKTKPAPKVKAEAEIEVKPKVSMSETPELRLPADVEVEMPPAARVITPPRAKVRRAPRLAPIPKVLPKLKPALKIGAAEIPRVRAAPAPAPSPAPRISVPKIPKIAIPPLGGYAEAPRRRRKRAGAAFAVRVEWGDPLEALGRVLGGGKSKRRRRKRKRSRRR